jgi:putative oxidoreductase
MFNTLVQTEKNWLGVILRLTLGGIMLPHGLQKVFGWFAGEGWGATMTYLTQTEGLPWVVAVSVILLESVGAFMILTGTLSRFFALGMAGLLLGMVGVHWQNGFFMDWYGQNPNPTYEGFEFHLLAIGLAVALVVNGSGRFSTDRLLMANR